MVLQNQTGGENFPHGPGNVFAVNGQGQSAMRNLKSPQSVFANYDLIGTVWMPPNTYNLTSNQTNAVGSVSLANSTAETFVQGLADPTTGRTLDAFLTDFYGGSPAPGAPVVVTGHSLGGCLTTVVLPWLKVAAGGVPGSIASRSRPRPPATGRSPSG